MTLITPLFKFHQTKLSLKTHLSMTLILLMVIQHLNLKVNVWIIHLRLAILHSSCINWCLKISRITLIKELLSQRCMARRTSLDK